MDTHRLTRAADGRRARTGLIAGLALALAAAVALVAYLAWPRQERAPDPVASLVASVQRQNSLTVFRAQVATVTTSRESRLLGLAPVEQVAVIPATVEYRLDLSQLSPRDFAWDPEAQRARVTLPPIAVQPPNLDEARARYLRSGVLVSARTQEALSRDNSVQATREAARLARDPELMRLAREAAVAAMARTIALPLRAAGFDRASVEVRFAGDARPTGDEWDYSRSVEEVLGNTG